MKKWFALQIVSLFTLLSLLAAPAAQALGNVPTSPTMTCTPVLQLLGKMYVECRLAMPNTLYFLVSELVIPFPISSLEKSTSPHASALSSVYQTSINQNIPSTTIATAALSMGNTSTKPFFQPSPLEGLSFLVKTDAPLGDLKTALNGKQTTLSFLSPDPNNNPASPLFQSITLNTVLNVDGLLLQEAVLQHAQSIGIIPFLRLAQSCYQQSSAVCVQNLIDSL